MFLVLASHGLLNVITLMLQLRHRSVLFSFLCWTQIVLCISYASSCSCVKGGTLPGQVQHMIIAIMFASLTVFLQRYCVVIVNGLFIVDAIIYWH